MGYQHIALERKDKWLRQVKPTPAMCGLDSKDIGIFYPLWYFSDKTRVKNIVKKFANSKHKSRRVGELLICCNTVVNCWIFTAWWELSFHGLVEVISSHNLMEFIFSRCDEVVSLVRLGGSYLRTWLSRSCLVAGFGGSCLITMCGEITASLHSLAE